MSVIHLISGLGADHSAFNALGKFTELEINCVNWIPNIVNEPLKAYAFRLIRQHEIEKGDIIIGLSFGGLVALEIAKCLNLEQIILISSFRDKQDLKPLFESLLRMGLHKLIPNVKLNSLNSFVQNLFNTSTKEGKLVLNEMLKKTDVKLTKWSIEKINESISVVGSKTRLKIHNLIGDNDKLVKVWRNENTNVIKGGGHFMIFENALEITEILEQILKT